MKVKFDIRVHRSGTFDTNDPGVNGGVENFTIRPAQQIQLWQTGNASRSGHDNDYYRAAAWSACLAAAGTFRDLGTCDAPGEDLWLPSSYGFGFAHHNFDWQGGDSREGWVGGFMPETISGSWQSAHRSMMIVKFDITDYPEFMNQANDGKRSLIIRGTHGQDYIYSKEPSGVDYLQDASVDIRTITTMPEAYASPTDLANDTTEIIGTIGNITISGEVEPDTEIPLTITSLNNNSEVILAFTMNSGYDTQPEYFTAVKDQPYYINRSLMFHHIWLKCGDG